MNQGELVQILNQHKGKKISVGEIAEITNDNRGRIRKKLGTLHRFGVIKASEVRIDRRMTTLFWRDQQ